MILLSQFVCLSWIILIENTQLFSSWWFYQFTQPDAVCENFYYSIFSSVSGIGILLSVNPSGECEVASNFGFNLDFPIYYLDDYFHIYWPLGFLHLWITFLRLFSMFLFIGSSLYVLCMSPLSITCWKFVLPLKILPFHSLILSNSVFGRCSLIVIK